MLERALRLLVLASLLAPGLARVPAAEEAARLQRAEAVESSGGRMSREQFRAELQAQARMPPLAHLIQQNSARFFQLSAVALWVYFCASGLATARRLLAPRLHA